MSLQHACGRPIYCCISFRNCILKCLIFGLLCTYFDAATERHRKTINRIKFRIIISRCFDIGFLKCVNTASFRLSYRNPQNHLTNLHYSSVFGINSFDLDCAPCSCISILRHSHNLLIYTWLYMWVNILVINNLASNVGHYICAAAKPIAICIYKTNDAGFYTKPWAQPIHSHSLVYSLKGW